MFETGMSALVLKICSEYAKALGLNFPPCVQQEINAIAQYVDLHTVKDLKVEQNGSVVTITCFTEGEQEKVFTVTLPEVNVDVLFNLIKGSSSVVVDKSEDGTHLVVRLEQNVLNDINSKLDKPANPTSESAVTMLADGTVGTKLLSDIGGGGGGKLYRHDVKITNIKEGSVEYFKMSFLSTSGVQTTDINQIVEQNDFKPIVGILGYIQIVLFPGAPRPFPLTFASGYFVGVVYIEDAASLYNQYSQSLSVSNAGHGAPANITHTDTVTEL